MINDNWHISPFYDIMYSPSRYNEHMTAFNGYGSNITKKTIELMVGLSGAKVIINIATEIYDIAKDFHRKLKLLVFQQF
ncbi:conserved hypothetical protein [Photorhabdus asymbiotica]|uniref:Uncharacterized protein n=1 Tax=Photorhabdus asymbiotica subsp. asymbiotica (strain ATCC 43949 / 3105-77) TaxID=553480 RepID=B6VMN9_PHOAA|nr:conserved hypothetical protein [Photorhabdus asymbiotica]CAR67419.1 Hypothetical Protein PA-RVA13-1290 [Photorhabdus asymbiotica subsp. asymbiotica ATCC 43949]